MPDERGRLEFGDRCAPSCDADSRMGWMKNFLRKFPVHAGSRSGLALCRKKQKSQSNAGKKTDFLAWRSLRKKVLWKRFKIVRAPLAACEYIAAVVTVIPFPPKENSRPSPGPLLDRDADAGSSGRSLETPQSPRICLDERSPLIISVFKSPVLWLQYIIKGKL